MYTKILIEVLLTGLHLHQLTLCTGQEQTIHLKIVTEDKKALQCADANATVLEGEPLKIQVDYVNHITDRRCVSTADSNMLLPFNNTTDAVRNVSKIQNVTADIGIRWKCTFWSLPSSTRRGENFGKEDKIGDQYYAAVDCNIRIHVRRKSAPQVVLVNDVVLPTERAPLSERDYDARALHRYRDGDELTLTCANVKGGTCTFPMMEYTGDAKFNLTSEVINTNRHISERPVWFRLRMGPEKNNTRAICECRLPADNSRVAVFFHMYAPAEEYPDIFINNVLLQPSVINGIKLSYKYEFRRTEHNLRMRVPYDVRCYNEAVDPVTRHDYQSWIVWELSKKTKFICSYYKNTSSIIFQGTEKFLINEEKNKCVMDAKLSQSSTVLNASLIQYRDKTRYLLYEYKDDTSVFTVKCSASCTSVPIEMDLLGSDGTSKSHQYSRSEKRKNIMITINKSDIIKDNIFECKVYEAVSTSQNRIIIMSTVLVLAPYVPPTNTSSSMTMTTTTTTSCPPNSEFSNSFNDSIIGATAAAVGIIFIIIIVIYKLKKRRNNKGDPQVQETEVDYENFKHNDSPIPPYPPQWESHYNVPADNFEDSTYSKPCTGVKIKPVLYSIPVGKKRRQKNNTQNPEGIYEDPNVKVVTDRPRNNHDSLEDINYAEVIPEGSKKQIDFMYGQVLPKTQRGRNLEGINYANMKQRDPNYAQPVPKSKLNAPNGGNLKYANVTDKPYVNAKKDRDYAEPAYCEVNYTNN